MASEIAKAAIARITKNQAISAKILIAMMDGIPVDQAIDRVLGAGTWKKLTSELYDELRKKDRASRPGAPDTFAVEDRFYFGKGRKERFAENVTYSVAAMIGSDPVGHRSVRSVEEAKAYAKQMLESFKSQAKGKPVLVEVYPVVNTEPKDAILVLRG